MSLPDAVDDPGTRIGLFPDWFVQTDARAPGFPLHDDVLIAALPPGLDVFPRDGDAPVVLTNQLLMVGGAGSLPESISNQIPGKSLLLEVQHLPLEN